jgi:protein SCO1/2
MKKLSSFRLLFWVLITAVALIAITQLAFRSSLPSLPKSTLSRNDLLSIGIDQRLGSVIPQGLIFTDSTGQKVNLSDLMARKPTLLALVYYNCPNLCTLVLNGTVSSVADLRRTVGDGFQIVVVSIDPNETAALAARKKATYLKRYSRGENEAKEWSFLVGDQANIQRLADAVGYRYRYDPSIHQYAHGSGIMMVDSHGRLVRYFLGIEYPPEEIEKAVQLAQNGQVDSPLQQFILLCYCYNPLTGPYGYLIFTLLKIGAGLTVAGLAAFIFIQLRREAQRKAAA